MAKFMMKELIDSDSVVTARLGAGSGSANYVTDVEIGKLVKLVAESRYGLCVQGDPIEGIIKAVEGATADDFSIGSVGTEGRLEVTADGLQATAGVGVIALGDYVVCGTVVVKGTALTAGAKVAKATNQPGATVTAADNLVATVNAAIAKVVEAQKNAVFGWRVVSLGSAGTGAVGTTIVIERVTA